mgnify:CR=1 FL=1
MLAKAGLTDDLLFFRPHQFLAREGETPDSLLYVQEGWACRYRLLSDGRRQITALYLPGDYCDPIWMFGVPGQPVVALTNVRAMRIAFRGSGVFDQDHQLRKALVENYDRQANWLMTLGRKTALERLAQLFFELFERMRRAGLAYGQQCALPLTQMDVADMTGLTSVHVNRTLQLLRSKGLVELQAKWLRIPDIEALREAAALPAISTCG